MNDCNRKLDRKLMTQSPRLTMLWASLICHNNSGSITELKESTQKQTALREKRSQEMHLN